MSIRSYKGEKVLDSEWSQIFLSVCRAQVKVALLMGGLGDAIVMLHSNTPSGAIFTFTLMNITRNTVPKKNKAPVATWNNDSYLVV